MFVEKLKNLIPSFGQESPYFLTIDLNSDTLKVYLNEIGKFGPKHAFISLTEK